MYTDEDLDDAVKKGIFTAQSVEAFRADIANRNSTQLADEENFKLISSFNDVFVVIACALLLLSAGWVAHAIHPAFAAVVVAAISWGLAEFFVLQRKMALPAIVLLITMVGGVFAAVILAFTTPSESSSALAGVAAAIAAWLHWRRFRVPITVAAGVAAVLVVVISVTISVYPGIEDHVEFLILGGGLVVFAVAMLWDASDLTRVTRNADVAFWLHITAAPLIVHPVFSMLGVFAGDESVTSLSLIIAMYVVLTLVSLTIDRRAFMVSSLVYVLVALTRLLETYGLEGDGFAYVGVFIGFSLLLLSGFWHKARSQVVVVLPGYIQRKVPPVTGVATAPVSQSVG